MMSRFYTVCVIFKVRVKGMLKAAISALVNNSPYCLISLWMQLGGIDNSMCLCAISSSPANLLEHGLHIIRFPIHDNM